MAKKETLICIADRIRERERERDERERGEEREEMRGDERGEREERERVERERELMVCLCGTFHNGNDMARSNTNINSLSVYHYEANHFVHS